MICILICLALVVQGDLIGLNISSLYPSFMGYDSLPYIDSIVRTENPLNFFVNLTGRIDVYLNSHLLTSLNQSSVIQANLSAGFNTLSLVGDSSIDLILPFSTCNNTQHSLAIGSYVCPQFDCGSTSSGLVTFSTSSSYYSARSFSVTKRHQSWTQVSSSLSFQLAIGVNYIQVLYNNTCAMSYKVFRTADSQMIVSLVVLGVNGYLEPRFSPDVFVYTVLPKLDSVTGLIYSLQAISQTACKITYSSSTGKFTDSTVDSGNVVSGLAVSYPNDLVIIKSLDASNKTSFYYLSIEVKSRNRYLNILKIYSKPTNLDLSSFDQVVLCCNSSEIYTVESFNKFMSAYTLASQNYTNSSFTIIAAPEDSNSALYLNGVEYLNSNKLFQASLGQNHIDLLVVAEDQSFSQLYTLDFFLKSNVSSISSLILPGLLPAFNPSILTYRSYLDFYSTPVSLTATSSDPSASLTLSPSFSTHSSLSSLSVTIPFQSLSMQLSLTVTSASPSFTSTYTITLLKNDICGNGLRFNSNEQCDDGNLLSGDGCSSTCTIEPNFACTGGSSTSSDICHNIPANPSQTPVCGNNLVEFGEECDDPSNQNCVNCTIILSLCGNGIVENGEECDEGGNMSDCVNCKKVSNGNVCGDGLRAPGGTEECDDGNNIVNDGCSNCTVDPGWTCGHSSLLLNINPVADTCSKNPINSTESNSTSGTNTTTNSSLSSNNSSHNNSYENQSRSSSGGFEYVGTVSFFIVSVSAVVLFPSILIANIGNLGLIPGVIFPAMVMQVIYSINNVSAAHSRFFQSFAWAHLRFFQPVHIHSRGTLDILGLEISKNPVFLENIQYWIYIFIVLSLIIIALAFFLKRPFLTLVLKLIFFNYFLLSFIPITYFSGLSLSNPDFSNPLSTFSFCISACALIIYIATYAYICFLVRIHQKSSPNSSIYLMLSNGLRLQTIAIPSQSSEKSHEDVSREAVAECHSFNEDLSQNEETGRKNLDNTDYKIRSEQISVYKYKSPESTGSNEIKIPVFFHLYLYELGAMSISSFIFACLDENYVYYACSFSILVLVVCLGFIAYCSPLENRLYLGLHGFALGMLILIICLLFADTKTAVFYIVIVLCFGILVAFMWQFAGILLKWMDSEEKVVKKLDVSHNDRSISYVRDSIPEERAPESATINHFSYEVSISEMK